MIKPAFKFFADLHVYFLISNACFLVLKLKNANPIFTSAICNSRILPQGGTPDMLN